MVIQLSSRPRQHDRGRHFGDPASDRWPFCSGAAQELLTMQFGLTETQQVLKNSAREFFPAECPIAEVRRLMETDTAHDPALWKKIADQGWCGIIFPEE